MFVAIDPGHHLQGRSRSVAFAGIEALVDDLHTAVPAVRAPGEGMFAARRRSEAEGVPVDPELWERILAL